MNRCRQLALVILAPLVVLAPLGCSPSSGSGSASGGGGAQCAWGFVMDPKNNVIWPETNAIFWSTPVVMLPGMEIIVTGVYPESRYMSLKTYNGDQVVDSVYDQIVEPDPGSFNPFNERDVPMDPELRRYTVTVRPGVPIEEGDNELAAFFDSAPSGLTILSYRVYVPDDPADLGGGELPKVTLSYFDGRIQKTLPECPRALPGTGSPTEAPDPDPETSEAFGAGNSQMRQSGVSEDSVTPIVFTRNLATNILPNPDDAYLVGKAEYEPGRIAVVRAKAPLFPDTRAGAHVTDPHDVRYWSMCVHMLRFPLPTSDCAGDFETTIDSSGYYTYVVSMPWDRPSGADSEHGVTWLPWGEPYVDVALTLRNMLPHADFEQAVGNVTEPGTEAAVMGEYYPIGGYCTSAIFEAGGPEACLPAG